MSVLAMIAEPSVVEADLAAGRLCCPVCERPLSPWGFARERTVRLLDETRSIRPRRACCLALRADARAAALVGGRPPARWRGGDRPCAAGEGQRAGAPHDRRPAPAAARDGARLAACLRAPRRARRRKRPTLDARTRRVSRPHDPARIPGRARGGRARQGGPRGPAAAGAQRLAMGARCRAHRLLHGRPRDPPGF